MGSIDGVTTRVKSLNPQALCHPVSFIHLIVKTWIWLCFFFFSSFFLFFLPSLPSSYTCLPTYHAPAPRQAHFSPAAPGGLQGLGIGRAAQHPGAPASPLWHYRASMVQRLGFSVLALDLAGGGGCFQETALAWEPWSGRAGMALPRTLPVGGCAPALQ